MMYAYGEILAIRNENLITSHVDLTPAPSPTRRGEKTPSPFGRGLG
jgi:hypothetical protein